MIFSFSFNFLFFCLINLVAQESKIDSLSSLLRKANPDTSKICILNELAGELFIIGSYDSSDQYAIQALEMISHLQKEDDYIEFIYSASAKAYNHIGNIARERAQYSVALESYEKAVNISEEIHERYPKDKTILMSIAVLLNSIGGTYYFTGDYDKSLAAYLKALPLFEQISNTQRMASCFNNIGLVHEAKKDFPKANEYYRQAGELFAQAGNKRGMANAFHNIGSIHFTKGEYEDALVNYSKAVNLNRETGNKNWLAFNYQNIGDVYLAKSDFSKALDFYAQALTIRKEISELRGIAISYASLGNAYLKNGNFSAAKLNLLISFKSMKELGTKAEILQVCQLLAQCDSAMGDYESAYKYHKIYSQTKDTIFNEESSRQFIEMQTKYETEKKQKENELLARENQIKSLEIDHQKNQRTILIVIIAFIFIIGIFIFKRIRLKHENKILLEKKLRANSVFQAQEKEKVHLSKELHDGLGPLLSLIKLKVSSLDQNSANEKMLNDIKELASSGMKEVRNISHALMPNLLDKQGLKLALKEFVSQISQTGSLEVVLDYSLSSKLQKDMELNLYRIVQESLNNVIKHASATIVRIQLYETDKHIGFVISDDGIGFEIEKVTSGNGLNNIYSRVDFLKGDINIKSIPPIGTTFVITIPKK